MSVLRTPLFPRNCGDFGNHLTGCTPKLELRNERVLQSQIRVSVDFELAVQETFILRANLDVDQPFWKLPRISQPALHHCFCDQLQSLEPLSDDSSAPDGNFVSPTINPICPEVHMCCWPVS